MDFINKTDDVEEDIIETTARSLKCLDTNITSIGNHDLLINAKLKRKNLHVS